MRPPDDYDVVAFDDNSSAATELAELVIAGVKRATASLARDFESGKAARPHVGAHVVVIDGEGVPRCMADDGGQNRPLEVGRCQLRLG